MASLAPGCETLFDRVGNVGLANPHDIKSANECPAESRVSRFGPVPDSALKVGEMLSSQLKVSPPRVLTIAYWLFLLAALVHLAAEMVVVVGAPKLVTDTNADIARRGQPSSVVNHVEALTVPLIISGLVLGFLMVAAVVIFDLFMRQGANWARIVRLILTVFSLGSITHTYGLGTLFAAIAVVATVLAFLRPSNAYFRAGEALKRADRSVSAPGH